MNLHAPFLVAAIAFSSTVQQDASNPGAAELSRALRALSAAEIVHFTGYVSAQSSGGDFGGSVMMVHAGGDSGKKFAGAIEIVRSKKDETCLISKSKLPELILFDDGARTLVRTTVEDEPITTAELAPDVSALLDLERLAEAIEKAGAKKHDDAPRFTCELPARFVKSGGGGLARSIGPKVMRVELEVTLDDAGAPAALKFHVTRSDPFAGITRRALESGGGAFSAGGADLTDDEEGPTSTYEIHVAKDAPSARLQNALTAMREVARDAR
jgi:hypothetical protein